MANKIRVYGKAQNRTALGIVNAYLVLNPQATIEDLRTAFPLSICNKTLPELTAFFYTQDEFDNLTNTHIKYKMFQDDPMTLSDGTTVYFYSLWIKDDIEALIAWAARYDIEVADMKPADGFDKGGYKLEYINGYDPNAKEPEPIPEPAPEPEPEPEKKPKLLLWAIVALAVIILALVCMRGCDKSEPEVITVEKIVHDTVWMQMIEKIEQDFNAAQFVKGSSELSESAKFVLHDLAKILNTHPDVKLKIVGHTSAEGDAAFNQKLSEERAKAAVDFLVNERQVNIDQLEYEGKGSSEPLDKNNQDLNRRTEFIVIN